MEWRAGVRARLERGTWPECSTWPLWDANPGDITVATPGLASVLLRCQVAASRGGKISFVDENMKGFGKTIIIDHDDGYSTVYAYNSQILVRVDQEVEKGTVIAKAGQSGRAASPRLHFEIRKKHEPQNPFYFLP